MNHRITYGLIIILCFVCPSIEAQNIHNDKYIAAKIPDTLLINANAVVRYESKSFTVMNEEEAVEKVHKIITIMNANGQNYSALELYYDKFHKIENLDGTLYDKDGNKIRTIGSDDIKDYAANSEYSLYDDNRVKYTKVLHNQFPYTIEYEYEISYNGYISWPSWYPESQFASIEYSKFEVSVLTEKKLRYWKNIDIEPKVQSEGKYSKYTWEISTLPPFEEEPVGPNVLDQYRCVRISPEQFKIDGFSGNLSSWKLFGEWFCELQEGRQVLPDDEKRQVLSIVSGISEEKEKIRVLYQYLQSSTRYVSVQLGIGGWQPFDASYVFEKKYGDCKALTNYMLSILKFAGVNAFPALIYNNRLPRKTILDFSSNQFNHVILFVPTQKETLWLECTNKYLQPGKIGNSNENRCALVIKQTGGELVRTPASTAIDNCLSRKSNVTIAYSGDAAADISSSFTGNQLNYVYQSLKESTPKEKEDWLKENIDIASFDLKNPDFSGLSSNNKIFNLKFQIDIPKYANCAGNRLMFQPNLMNKRSYLPKPLKERKQPIVLSYPYFDIDTVVYRIPIGFTIEAISKPVNIDSSFAKYSAATTQVDPQTLIYSRSFEMKFTELPAEMYNSYRKFLEDVIQADKKVIVLKR
ncbi:MAG: DUF3857 and transglutaminase domain-containing protein [Ignavibacteriales bacterium]|nr:DUF3857 and transglutaminase domain-containing protein [Ignavibacteriales bacterium]